MSKNYFHIQLHLYLILVLVTVLFHTTWICQECYPFRTMSNMPDKLVNKIPEIVQRSPVLILAGLDDILVPPRWSQSGAKTLKNTGLEVTYVGLKGSHCTMLKESPNDYERAVLDFFKIYEIN